MVIASAVHLNVTSISHNIRRTLQVVLGHSCNPVELLIMEMEFILEKCFESEHILIDQQLREKMHIRIRSNQTEATTYLRD